MEKYKIGYVFSKKTSEFLAAETVWLEEATGEYPHAYNVVFVKPPEAAEGTKQVWTGDTWKLVEDHRGQTWYKPDGSYGGVIEKLGAVAEILKKPPKPQFGSHLKWDRDDWHLEPDEGFVIEDGKVREMTPEERLEAGKITLAEYNEHQRQMREAMYNTSTDKLGLMYIRGEITMEEWQAAIQAVKEQFPYK